MAITLKEIREKEFALQSRGYAQEEVQDFLDDIADQMETLLRESRALSLKVAELENAAAAPAVEAAPAKDDSAYFRTLENTLRDTLLNAQRSANETVTAAQQTASETVTAAENQAAETVTAAQLQAEETLAAAQQKAEETVAAAETQAKELVDNAQAKVNELQDELDTLRAAAENYRQNFLALVQNQMSVLKSDEILF